MEHLAVAIRSPYRWRSAGGGAWLEVLGLRRAIYAIAVLLAVLSAATTALAVQAVNVDREVPAIDLTDAVERQQSEGDRVQVSTAPGPDGIVRRIEVRAREGGNNWAVFALANTSDEQFDRLIVVPHYQMVGSGLIWPDLWRWQVEAPGKALAKAGDLVFRRCGFFKNGGC